jgi:hypothetical protein
LAQQLSPKRCYAGLLRDRLGYPASAGLVQQVVKVKAHCDPSLFLAGSKQRFEAQGNEHADTAAKRAIEHAPLGFAADAGLLAEVRVQIRNARETLKFAGRVLPDWPRHEREGIVRAVPKAGPLQHFVGAVGGLGGLSGGSSQGPASLADIVKGVGLETTQHRIFQYEIVGSSAHGKVLVCMRCGAFGSRCARRLAQACPGSAPNFGAAEVLRRVRAGRHPNSNVKAALAAGGPLALEGAGVE